MKPIPAFPLPEPAGGAPAGLARTGGNAGFPVRIG